MATQGPYINEPEARALDQQAINAVRPGISAEIDQKVQQAKGGTENVIPSDELPENAVTLNLKQSGVYTNIIPTGGPGDPIEVVPDDFNGGYPIAWKDQDGFWHKNIVENPILDDYTTKTEFEPVQEKTSAFYPIYDDGFYVVDADGNVLGKITGEGVFGKNINELQIQANQSTADIANILQELAGYGNTCRIQENKGIYAFPNEITKVGTNCEIKESTSLTKFSKKSYQALFTGNDRVNIKFDKLFVGATSVSIWWMLPLKYNNIGSSNIDFIRFQLTLNGTLVGSSVDQFSQYAGGQQGTGWNLLKFMLTDFGSPVSFNGISIQVFLLGGAVSVGNYKMGFLVDSMVVNQRLRPTITISYDRIWAESHTQGLYQYHKDNNIPFTIIERDINSTSNSTAAFVFVKNLVRDGLACVGFYTEGMKNDATYPTYTAKRNFAKGEMDLANNKADAKVISVGCAENLTTNEMINAFKEIGIKAVRGSGETYVNYIDDFFFFGVNGYYSLAGQTTEQQDAVIQSAKTYIDKLILMGSSGSIMTHGVYPLALISQPGLHTSPYVWFAILDYIKTKRDAGLLHVAKFDDLYYSANGLNND